MFGICVKYVKTTSTQYAKSLYEVTADKSHAEVDVLISNFVKVISKNGHLKMKKEILRKFEAVSNMKNGIVVAEVISREKLNSELVDKLDSFIKAKYQAKKVLIENRIDEKIQGGIIVKMGNEIFDASIAGQLKKMQNILAH